MWHVAWRIQEAEGRVEQSGGIQMYDFFFYSPPLSMSHLLNLLISATGLFGYSDTAYSDKLDTVTL